MKRLILLVLFLLFSMPVSSDMTITGVALTGVTMGGGVTAGDALLLETGDALLLETGDKLLLE